MTRVSWLAFLCDYNRKGRVLVFNFHFERPPSIANISTNTSTNQSRNFIKTGTHSPRLSQPSINNQTNNTPTLKMGAVASCVRRFPHQQLQLRAATDRPSSSTASCTLSRAASWPSSTASSPSSRPLSTYVPHLTYNRAMHFRVRTTDSIFAGHRRTLHGHRQRPHLRQGWRAETRDDERCLDTAFSRKHEPVAPQSHIWKRHGEGAWTLTSTSSF